MLIKSSTALRNDYDGLVKLVNEREEPVYITRNGEGEMVFLSIEMYERREAELQLMKKLLEAERNRTNGATSVSVAEMRAELEEIYNA